MVVPTADMTSFQIVLDKEVTTPSAVNTLTKLEYYLATHIASCLQLTFHKTGRHTDG